MKQKRKSKESIGIKEKTLFMPDENMGDGAAMALAAEMSGMDYDEYCMELVSEEFDRQLGKD